MTDDPYKGSRGHRELDDGQVLAVYPMIFTTRLCIGTIDTWAFGYQDAWCYPSPVSALLAMATWDGEGDPPDGWTRHIGSGRRRPDGDPKQEYVSP